MYVYVPSIQQKRDLEVELTSPLCSKILRSAQKSIWQCTILNYLLLRKSR